jgi:hypothetical protein
MTQPNETLSTSLSANNQEDIFTSVPGSGKLPEKAKILIYAPLAVWSPHWETHLEIAQRHLDRGDDVEFVVCDAELESCEPNPAKEPSWCLRCISRRAQGLELLDGNVTHRGITELKEEDLNILQSLPETFESTDDLKAVRIGQFDLGYAVASSVIDWIKTPEIDTDKYQKIISVSLKAAARVYLSARNILNEGIDRVYLFNGRFHIIRGFLRACQEYGIEFYAHERGSRKNKFSLMKNAVLHDFDFRQESAKETWERSSYGSKEREEIARKFYIDRRNGVEKFWYSFTRNQATGKLPDDWGKGERKIVFFTSSEYEFAAIGDDYNGRIYPNQVNALEQISKALEAYPDIHLFVRIHPNDKSESITEKYEALASPQVTIIRPESKIHSYALLEEADRVLTFGSTIGIEATYWGCISICGDRSFYDKMDAVWMPKTHEELIDMLVDTSLKPKPVENTLCYGYDSETLGEEFRYFEVKNIIEAAYDSEFKGKALKPTYGSARSHVLDLYKKGFHTRVQRLLIPLIRQAEKDYVLHMFRSLSLLNTGHVQEGCAEMYIYFSNIVTSPGGTEEIDKILSQIMPQLLNMTKKAIQSGSHVQAVHLCKGCMAITKFTPGFKNMHDTFASTLASLKDIQ